MAGIWRTAFDPRVSDHLISDEGEIVIDEVRRHYLGYLIPALIGVLGLVILVTTLWAPVRAAWLPLAAGLTLLVVGGYRLLRVHMDRFVITNMRVFRVYGIFGQHTATMPMSRILDITVHKPLLGRILGYGHFVFESAAQEQGLRDMRYIARADERDLTIQRVIQRSGLRTNMRPVDEDDEDSEMRSPSTPDEPAQILRNASMGDVGDYLDIRDPDDSTADDSSSDRDRKQSDEEWLAGGWSDKDAADYRRRRRNRG